MFNTVEKTKPFLKWPGNKYRIIDEIVELLPDGDRLVEPFAGSGSIFLNTSYPEKLVADNDEDLIRLFKHVQMYGEEFIEYASEVFVPENNVDERYYELRKEFNTTHDTIRKSALLIYLNRHCFNGLYRKNKKGEFNAAYGKYKKPYFPRKELKEFHIRSEDVVFKNQDFLETLDMVEDGDVVYCDPPYTPLKENAAHVYGSLQFGDNEHIALVNKAKKVSGKGIPVLISNHDIPLTRELYNSAHIETFEVSRTISSKASSRGKVSELLAIY